MQNTLQISRKSDYALRAVIRLARLPKEQVINFKNIAQTERIPEEYLAKILRALVLRGLVRSIRGARGGYQLARQPSEISFLDVIEATDGPISINTCLGNGGGCPIHNYCSMHQVWRRAQDAMLEVFRGTTLHDVIQC
jgi:Rrf2 family protein